tara:strand:+ start:319 stop:945 length:627 start_codon:yes stop_codon:yes gene_type:complete
VKKLVEALVKAQSEMTSAVATGTNPHFRSEYAPLDEVIKAVKKPLNSNGIFFLQKVYVADNGQCVETEFHGHDAVLKGGKVFVKCDKATSQGYGSSLSYAKRYSLQTACGLPTGDDDDANASTDEAKPVAKPSEKLLDEKKEMAKAFANNLLAIAEGITEDVSGVESIMEADGNQKKLQALEKRYPDVYKDLTSKIEKIKLKLSSQGE